MSDALGATADIVSAHVRAIKVDSDQLPQLIRSVYDALTVRERPASEVPKPAVPIGNSAFDDHLICLECGQSFQSLTMHLRRVHEISTDGYRARFRLPHSYPMAAPAYSRRRAEVARRTGLGRKGILGKSVHGRHWLASGEGT